MEKYDYYAAVKEDAKNYMDEMTIDFQDFTDRDAIIDFLHDEMWVADSVTGNASGSYTFNTWVAEENICHNLDLYEEAEGEFGGEVCLKSAETMDVIIRCYILGQVLSDVVDEYLEENSIEL